MTPNPTLNTQPYSPTPNPHPQPRASTSAVSRCLTPLILPSSLSEHASTKRILLAVLLTTHDLLLTTCYLLPLYLLTYLLTATYYLPLTSTGYYRPLRAMGRAPSALAEGALRRPEIRPSSHTESAKSDLGNLGQISVGGI